MSERFELKPIYRVTSETNHLIDLQIAINEPNATVKPFAMIRVWDLCIVIYLWRRPLIVVIASCSILHQNSLRSVSLWSVPLLLLVVEKRVLQIV